MVQVCWACFISDDNPVSLGGMEFDWGPKPFKIFNFQLDDVFFQKLINENWNSYIAGNKRGPTIWRCLRDVRPLIKNWSLNTYGNTKRRIELLEEELHSLDMEWQVLGVNFGDRENVMKKHSELWDLYLLEEHKWKQISHIQWVTE